MEGDEFYIVYFLRLIIDYLLTGALSFGGQWKLVKATLVDDQHVAVVLLAYVGGV